MWYPIFNKLKGIAAIEAGEAPAALQGAKRKNAAANCATPTHAKGGGKARAAPIQEDGDSN